VPTTHQPARYSLAVIASVLAGGMVALQTRINGEFGVALDNGALAALLSFATGLVLVAAVTLMLKRGRVGMTLITAAIRSGELRWWAVLGGAGGAFYVLSQGLSAGLLGVALFTVATVTGQTLGAVLIDTRGWLGSVLVPLTLWRIIGSIVVVLGVVIALDLSVADFLNDGVVLALPILAGVAAGYQQAVNGRVSRVAGFAGSATLINFVVGTAVLLVAFLVSIPFLGLPAALPTVWWLWLGGAVGGVFIAIQASTVSVIGVLGLGVSLVSGQLVGSILLDVFVPVGDVQVTAATLVGAVITLVGALVVTLTKKPARTRTR